MQEIGDLVMALQGGERWQVKSCVDSICQALCGEQPTDEDMRHYIDADF